METLWQDLRYSARMLWKKPGLTATAVLALTLGIGANSAIFSIVQSVLLRPLPYSEPDRLVMVWASERKGVATPDWFLAWKEYNDVFEDMAGYEESATTSLFDFSLTGGDIPARVSGASVSENLFTVLGVQAAYGRTFSSDEGVPGNDRVVVLSNGLWRRHFNADPGVVGSTISLDGKGYSVIGIMPPEFKLTYPRGSDLFVPINIHFDSGRNALKYKTVARLKPGITIQQAQQTMTALGNSLAAQKPGVAPRGILVSPLHDEVVGSSRRGLILLAVAVAFVLLIACVNTANILLARAVERNRELIVRAALGASRLRLVRQMLTETLVLSLISGVLGILLALWGVWLLTPLFSSTISRMDEVQVDGWVLGFTFLISVLTGVLCGLAPVLTATKVSIIESLKEGGTVSPGRQTHRLRGMLVVCEVALAMVLLVSAGLVIKSLWNIRSVDWGFNTEKILTVQMSLPYPKYSKPEQKLTFTRNLLEHVTSLPGVQAASVASTVPVRRRGRSYIKFNIDGRPQLDRPTNAAWALTVDENYFSTMGIPLAAGRGFTDQDKENSPKVVMINQALARAYFTGENPIGQRIHGMEIIGIVENARHYSVIDKKEPKGLGIPEDATLYKPWNQDSGGFLYLLVRTSVDTSSLAAAVRNEVGAIEKDLPLDEVSSVAAMIAESESDSRLYTVALSIFAGVALTLTVTGIYGVLSYSVRQRSREIGIRMAVGAKPADVMKLVIGQSLTLALVGVGLGLLLSVASTRILTSFLYEVSPTDPAILALVALMLAGAALLASYIPTRAALKVDPTVVLRYE